MSTQVGEASVALTFETKGAASKLKSDVGLATKSAEKTISSWSVAAGNITARAFEKVASVVKDSLSGGIERFDTINRFPKVMQAIGYSAEEASESVQAVWQYVQGLPTPFNEALSAVQRLASSTSSLEEATELYTAMNNALLSGGASIDRQSQVMNQWLEAVSRGSFFGNEFKDMMEAMPGVMNIAAKELLGPTAGTEKLRDAMSSGKITMGQFLDEVKKLNKEGSENFVALEKQAKVNTEGVSTSLTTMRQSVENIWMHVMEAIGQDNIQNALGAIEDKIDAIGDALVDLVNWAKDNKDWLLPLAEGVVVFVAALAAVGKAIAIAKSLAALTTPIGLITVAIAAVAALVVTNWDKIQPILQLVWEWIELNILPAVQGLMDWISSNVSPIVDDIFSHLQPFFANVVAMIKALWDDIVTVVQAIMPIVQPVLAILVGAVNDTITAVLVAIDIAIAIIDTTMSAAVWTWKNIISPIVGFISGIINAIVSLFAWMAGQVIAPLNGVRSAFINVFNNVKAIVSAVVSSVAAIITSIPGRIAGKINEIKDRFVEAFNQVKDFVKGVVDTIVNFIMSIPSRIAGVGGEVANSIMSGLGDIGGKVGGAITSGVSSAVSGLGGAVQGALSAIGLASGGYVRATPGGTLAVIGEGGEDEFVIPRSQMIDILTGVANRPLPELRAENMRVDGGGVAIYNTFQINNELDAEDIGRRINNSIRLATS